MDPHRGTQPTPLTPQSLSWTSSICNTYFQVLSSRLHVFLPPKQPLWLQSARNGFAALQRNPGTGVLPDAHPSVCHLHVTHHNPLLTPQPYRVPSNFPMQGRGSLSTTNKLLSALVRVGSEGFPPFPSREEGWVGAFLVRALSECNRVWAALPLGSGALKELNFLSFLYNWKRDGNGIKGSCLLKVWRKSGPTFSFPPPPFSSGFDFILF